MVMSSDDYRDIQKAWHIEHFSTKLFVVRYKETYDRVRNKQTDRFIRAPVRAPLHFQKISQATTNPRVPFCAATGLTKLLPHFSGLSRYGQKTSSPDRVFLQSIFDSLCCNMQFSLLQHCTVPVFGMAGRLPPCMISSALFPHQSSYAYLVVTFPDYLVAPRNDLTEQYA